MGTDLFYLWLTQHVSDLHKDPHILHTKLDQSWTDIRFNPAHNPWNHRHARMNIGSMCNPARQFTKAFNRRFIVPRRGRLILPDMPHHIVQRGHNRHAVFDEEADYQYYLSNLIEWKLELQIKVYSYCLMENHIHIIVNPGEFPANVGKLMKRVAARQTRYVNKMKHRTGSLWDSRYKISPIESDGYLLQCSRYVDLNPVKAKMCASAEQYRWSSYRAKLGMVEAVWLDSDPCYSALGDTVSKRRINYKAFVEDAAGADAAHQFIQTAISRNQLTGSRSFINEVEKRTGFRIENRGRGRPAAQEDDE